MTTPTPLFWGSRDHPEGEIQDAEVVAREMEEVIVEVGTLSTLSAVITDSAPVMKAAKTLLGEKFPQVFYLGCSAHAVDLLLKDLAEDEVFFFTPKEKESLSCLHYGKRISFCNFFFYAGHQERGGKRQGSFQIFPQPQKPKGSPFTRGRETGYSGNSASTLGTNKV